MHQQYLWTARPHAILFLVILDHAAHGSFLGQKAFEGVKDWIGLRTWRLHKEYYSACGKTSKQDRIEGESHFWVWVIHGSSGLKPNFVCIARALRITLLCQSPFLPSWPDSLYSLSTTPTLCTLGRLQPFWSVHFMIHLWNQPGYCWRFLSTLLAFALSITRKPSFQVIPHFPTVESLGTHQELAINSPGSPTSWPQHCSVPPRQWPLFCRECPSSGRTPEKKNA